MKMGMVITIEPMINFGSAEVVVLDDGWTVVSKDGSPSAQFEHSILVTAEGTEILTPSPVDRSLAALQRFGCAALETSWPGLPALGLRAVLRPWSSDLPPGKGRRSAAPDGAAWGWCVSFQYWHCCCLPAIRYCR